MAHRVIEIKLADAMTFSPSNNWDMVEYLNIAEQLGDGGGGLVDVSTEDLQAMLDDNDRGFEIDDVTAANIRKDIEAVKDAEYVEYLIG